MNAAVGGSAENQFFKFGIAFNTFVFKNRHINPLKTENLKLPPRGGLSVFSDTKRCGARGKRADARRPYFTPSIQTSPSA